jgi:hypothetical protein
MRVRVPLLLAALLVVGVVVGAGPAGAQPAVEETRLAVQLQDDGDANWTVVVTVPLADDADVDNFRSFAQAYEAGERDIQLGVDAFRRAAAAASNASGREMTITNETRSAELVGDESTNGSAGRYGVVRASFTWTAFARFDENGTMYVDDAFRTNDGTWLRGLGENQTLVVRRPPGYSSPTTSPVGPRGGDLRWEGPQRFEPGYFEIVYEPATGPQRPFDLDVSTALLAGALVLSAAALVVGLFLLYRRRDGEAGRDRDAEAVADAARTGDADEAAATADIPAAESAAAGAGAGAEQEPDLELLSDEERVEYLLEESGGRMKQADIVKETGWSNAKVSQLLSSMADEGRVDKLRIGRENLISLPDEGVVDLDDRGEG